MKKMNLTTFLHFINIIVTYFRNQGIFVENCLVKGGYSFE